MWEGAYFTRSATPLPQGGGAPALPNLGVHLYAHALYSRTNQFDMLTHMGSGFVLGISHAHTPRGRGASAP